MAAAIKISEKVEEKTAGSSIHMGKKKGWSMLMPGFLVVVAIVFSLAFPPKSGPGGLIMSPAAEICTCQYPKLTGVVDDCCCDFETVETLNREVLNPVLMELVTKPFFRYFKVRLWCDCPFWPDDGMCHLRDCSVCECTEEEVPPGLRSRSSADGEGRLQADSPQCQEGKPHSAVDRTLEPEVLTGWSETDNPWTSDNETDVAELTYVNLLLNPERYTGYKGDSALRIWQAIYAENCFQDGPNDTCAERRVFYRLISGLHTSINTHICANYLVDEEKGVWGQNLEMFRWRIASHPQRLQNLYFIFLFVLRAASKASDHLAHAEYSTGNPQEDAETTQLVRQLVLSDRLRSACPMPFDEAQMWNGKDGPQLKKQLQSHFRNISAIMDCVGCEKCRLWGKLQMLGLATSLKILFSLDEEGAEPTKLLLQRNEVIALVNLLGRLSESIKEASEMTSSLEAMPNLSVQRLSSSIEEHNVVPPQERSANGSSDN